MTDVATDQPVSTFTCSRAALESGGELDPVAARAHDLGAGASVMVSVAIIRSEGVSRFDIWPESDPAVVHARDLDPHAAVEGMVVERAALPLVLGTFITRRTGPWPLGRRGTLSITSMEELADAVEAGDLEWAVVATRAVRGDEQSDLQIVASDSNAILAGVATGDGFPILAATSASVALGRLLTLTYTVND